MSVYTSYGLATKCFKSYEWIRAAMGGGGGGGCHVLMDW